jgi:predicted Zn finger-like uncharacterized protein
MDVSCPACAARYTADDEKLRGKTARMRCKACHTAWLVPGPSVQAPTERRAAVLRKGAEREKRDLFAARSVDDGGVKQTLLPPPSTGFTATVGARNENSVLFSLDQLGLSARVNRPENAPAPQSRTAPADDEGVIDLKTLSTPPRTIGLPVAPLFSEPAGMSLDVSDSGQRPITKTFSTMQLVGGIAAAVALILVAGFGIALTFKGEEPVKHSATAMVVPPPPAVAPPPKAEPPPAAVASASTDDDAKNATDTKDTKDTKGKGRKGAKPRAGKSGTVTSKTPAPAAKPVKAADPCHCKGDFNCILACTAKGKQ